MSTVAAKKLSVMTFPLVGSIMSCNLYNRIIPFCSKTWDCSEVLNPFLTRLA
jgi:hypothetical protein